MRLLKNARFVRYGDEDEDIVVRYLTPAEREELIDKLLQSLSDRALDLIVDYAVEVAGADDVHYDEVNFSPVGRAGERRRLKLLKRKLGGLEDELV